MAYYCNRYDDTPSNVLPSGKAGVALSCGDLVYLDSSGLWQLAASVDPNTASASRKDAMGVMTADALQYDTVSPVRKATFRGWTSLTIGSKRYLSATGTTTNTITATKPTQTIVQEVGFARSASEIEIDVPVSLGMFQLAGISIGANASVVGSAPVLSSSKTSVLRVYGEDGGVAATGAIRTILGRLLLAGAHASGDLSAFGVCGQVKITASVGSIGHKAGLWGYCELADDAAAIASDSCSGVYAMLDVPTAASIAASAVASGLQISSNSLAGTHTGVAAMIHCPNPVAGTWDYAIVFGSAPGAVAANTHSIDSHALAFIIKARFGSTDGYIPAFASVPA